MEVCVATVTPGIVVELISALYVLMIVRGGPAVVDFLVEEVAVDECERDEVLRDWDDVEVSLVLVGWGDSDGRGFAG